MGRERFLCFRSSGSRFKEEQQQKKKMAAPTPSLHFRRKCVIQFHLVPTFLEAELLKRMFLFFKDYPVWD